MKLLDGIQRKIEIEHGSCLGAEEFDACVHERGEKSLSLYPTPDVERHPATRDKDPRNLVHRSLPVREVLQPLLAQHDVETRIWKRHCRRAPKLPVDAWVLPSRVEHALIH